MRYASSRAKICTGDVLAWSHRSWRSWADIQMQLVRIFTRSEYSHVGIAWVTGGRVFVLESVVGGIRIYPLSLSLPVFVLGWAGLSEAQLEFALSKIGQPYSKWEAVKAFFGRNSATDGQWQCAEYVCAVHGLSCDATPSAVVEYLLHNGSILTEVSP